MGGVRDWWSVRWRPRYRPVMHVERWHRLEDGEVAVLEQVHDHLPYQRICLDSVTDRRLFTSQQTPTGGFTSPLPWVRLDEVVALSRVGGATMLVGRQVPSVSRMELPFWVCILSTERPDGGRFFSAIATRLPQRRVVPYRIEGSGPHDEEARAVLGGHLPWDMGYLRGVLRPGTAERDELEDGLAAVVKWHRRFPPE